MRSIFKPILFGLLIGMAIMAAIYVSAVMGSGQAVNLLLKMTLPPFNIAAAFMEPVSPDDMERGGKMLDLLLLVAWAQISLIATAAIAGIRAMKAHKQQ